jgi:hypothetical protein
MRPLDPPKPVVVRRDGQWHDGELQARRRDIGGWLGYVRYAVSRGLRDLEWMAAERVRRLKAHADGVRLKWELRPGGARVVRGRSRAPM